MGGREMFEPHPHLEDVPDGRPIWRYIDFTKLADMLSRRSLYFSRADLVGDPYEGALPKAGSIAADEFEPRLTTEEAQQRADAINRQLRSSAKVTRTTMFLNCWHGNAHE